VAEAAPRLQATEPDLPADAVRPGAAGRLLDAALGLFAQRGFAGTSIRDIATAAGLTSAALYSHFESKEQLLAELVRAGHEEHHVRLRRALLDGGDPVTQLRRVVDAHVRFHAEHPVLGTVCNNELHALPSVLAAPALALRTQYERLLQEIVERGVALGVFAPPDVWMTIAAIGGMGIRVAAWYSTESTYTVDEVASTYADLALRMVTAP
jgi:AcrR family transcriptional regulator